MTTHHSPLTTIHYPLLSCQEWREEVECPLGGGGAFVAVAGELDVETAAIVGLAEGGEDGREVHFSIAEHQVLVDTGSHVFDVDVDDFAFPLPNVVGNGKLPQAMQMANVERQLDIGCVQALLQLGEPRHRSDEHPRLWLKADGDAVVMGIVEN